MTKRTIILDFSARKHGSCEQIAEFIAKNCNNSATIYRISEQTIHSCSNCEYECFAKDKRCPYFDDDEVKILDEINKSDEVYFIVPNYCGHPPAMLYSFNERSVCWFHGNKKLLEQYMSVKKRFIVVSNSKPESFRLAFKMHTNEPEILWLGASAFGLRSMDGDLMASVEAQSIVRAFVEKS